ncbi:MAG TPA: APC family permease [Thermoleophilia bacterium]|nr:APC family permease [Thermoleophilia bacterium]
MAEETVVFARKASGLVREMSWFDVLLFTLAGPAGGGMTYYAVKMPGLYPGANMVWAFIIGFIVWVPVVLVIAAFASSFPRSGALYVVTSRVLHPMFGFIPNWIYVICGGCGMAAGFIFYQAFIPIAGTLQLGGEMSGSQGMTDAADWLADAGNKFWVVFAFMFVVWGLELLGLDKLKWVMRAIIYTPLVGTIVAFIFLFAVDGQTAFDEIYGAGKAMAVIQAADAAGVEDAVMSAWDAMSGVLLAVLWAYSALEVTSFVGSEVKTPRTSFIRGLFGGAVAVGVLYTLNAWSSGFSFGSEFIRDYAWLFYTDETTYAALEQAMGQTPPQPTMPFYAGINSGSATLTVILGICYFCWLANTSLLIWMAGVRGIFSMAFDRQLPLKLASVSSSGNPTWANHFLAIFSFLGVVMAYGDSVGANWAIETLAMMDYSTLFFIWPMGLAAIFLPYLRPDLYEKSTFQYTVGGVPLITIIGVACFLVGWWMIGVIGQYMVFWSYMAIAIMLALGFILVAFMYNRNRKEGIDPNRIFTEIPPA